MKGIQEFLDEAIREARGNLYPEIGKVSCPVLEVVIRTVVVVDQKRMAAVTKSPIKASMHSVERTEGEGIPSFFRGL